jgi:hypothetical protein
MSSARVGGWIVEVGEERRNIGPFLEALWRKGEWFVVGGYSVEDLCNFLCPDARSLYS